MKIARKDQIIHLVTENRIVKANELAEKFQVSMETIRRDLEQLEKEQIVRRVHGGAVLNVASGIEPDYSYREIKNYEQKIMIGKKAAELVKDGDTIIIDIGTTTLQMAKFLRGKSITVFTNSIKFAQELMDEEKVQLYLLGGKVRRGEGSTSGFMAEDHVDLLLADKLFLGVAGLDERMGVMDFHIEECNLRRHCVSHSKEIIALADYSKVGQRALNQVCLPEKIDILITDERADKQILKRLRERGVETVIA
ncbi:DeoR family transcriptional regulator [Fusobacterium naviforme]|uniref:DeoR/GlpR family transcriptional regulator of sugar metabolism n=1 Tax=Moryella indoligenes TaxID=371674 RepID=A0AAE3VA11_9FIRM|nr:DeoR/GlpR family DNA-binding transcription regulator [Moryella indoligenes]KAB0577983.1 DeoR/GlpR transcriptional regulator [Fusobacterium naviforme]MDQ0152370.1 DeoR/GlpR family transcriptional regulator of sugar metabolism [Moryella indoligenes]PSL10782.1 DeoR family transcriptional regulator [Fusobacterium naviforme]STO27335.1 HTH-type transcriptional repressor glcR [Fusobacterium naviforme]